MKPNFIAALRTATGLTRAGKINDATRLIQDTLTGVGDHSPDKSSANDAAFHLPDLRADAQDQDQGEHAQISSPHGLGIPVGARPRRPLGETITLLKKGAVAKLGSLKAMLPHAREPVSAPQGSQFVARSFSGSSGQRAYKLYIPNASSAVKGLVVMLHGCTQDPDDFAAGTGMNALAEERGLIIAYPAQPRTANISLCWNWFDLKDQKRGGGEPAIIAGLTGSLIAEFGIPRRSVFVAGLSAGGAMAVVMGAAYPDLYAAIGVHSGLPYGAASDLISAMAAMRGERAPQTHSPANSAPVRTIVFHGDADHTVHPSNGEEIAAAAIAETGALREESMSGQSAGGVDYLRTVARNPKGLAILEYWKIHGLGHAWSGGNPSGSYTAPTGPDASREMIRFFLER